MGKARNKRRAVKKRRTKRATEQGQKRMAEMTKLMLGDETPEESEAALDAIRREKQ